MTRGIGLAAIGAVVVGLVACQQGPAALSEEDIAAIHGIERDFAQAALDGDWDRLVGYFTEDAIRMPYNTPMEQGRETIREHFEVVDSITQWTIHESEVFGEGNLAFLRQAYTITGFVAGMSGGLTYTGKSLTVLRRQPDGRWLYVMDIWTSDAPFEMSE